jgi:hypothetical protein
MLRMGLLASAIGVLALRIWWWEAAAAAASHLSTERSDCCDE